MKKLRSFGSLAGVIALCAIACADEPSRSVFSSNRTERLLATSNLIAKVRVLAIEFIGKPNKVESGRIVSDVFRYGRLVTLQIVELHSSKVVPTPDKLYIFQKGAAQGLEHFK